MNDFRIILENTFNFKEGRLYLMLLRENGKFAVEAVDKSKTFGRKFLNDKNDANDVFNDLTDRLGRFSDLKTAERFLNDCFSLKSLNKFKFSLVALENTISQKEIVLIRKKVKFRTLIRLNFNKRDKEEGSLTVYIYCDDNVSPFGVMVGDMNGKNLKFEIIRK